MTEAPESGLTFLVSCFFVWLTWFQLFRNTPLTSGNTAPSSTPVQEEDPDQEYPEDLVDKGVYSQTYKKDMCESKCKIKTLKTLTSFCFTLFKTALPDRKQSGNLGLERMPSGNSIFGTSELDREFVMIDLKTPFAQPSTSG